jgi:hypothetical protein
MVDDKDPATKVTNCNALKKKIGATSSKFFACYKIVSSTAINIKEYSSVMETCLMFLVFLLETRDKPYIMKRN